MIGNVRCCSDIHWGGKDLCHCAMDFCWLHDKIKSNVKCRCKLVMTGETPKQKRSIAQCTSAALLTALQLTPTIFHNKNLNKWDIMFGFEYFCSCNIARTQYHPLGLNHTNFRSVGVVVVIIAIADVGTTVNLGVWPPHQSQGAVYATQSMSCLPMIWRWKEPDHHRPRNRLSYPGLLGPRQQSQSLNRLISDIADNSWWRHQMETFSA